ncbi:hypothetical protein WUBG_18673 [Wuchereria bancrofti]|uniref:Uncharacterized protein n=1 Tax=Wuchereria bancrofti TaxID=6293 RepID=J9A8Y3_WUCBA|nr:hypothetical protein WUBG_18673 [Wuchereria bancrofti]
MALSLASSLIRCGTFDAANIACSYVSWCQSKPPDIGNATRNALTIGIGKRLSSNWHHELNDVEKEEITSRSIK